MKKITQRFTGSSTEYYFACGISHLRKITGSKNLILVTDENVYGAHEKRFRNHDTIVLKPGEAFKVQSTVDALVDQLIDMKAGRQTVLVGVGGGVVTDLTGYVASVYLRGIRFGFVPTTILGLVDASIGGKNGIDVGVYKNMVGLIRQPSFILHDMVFLNSLPEKEWINGFAEIIKHACIGDAALFTELEAMTLAKYRSRQKSVCELVQRNALFKTRLVKKDEFEKGDRRMLNFGHTIGHAIENQYALAHGEAISIGMTAACRLSEKLTGFKQTGRVTALLEKYNLPAYAKWDAGNVFGVLTMDKKRENDRMHFVLLEKIGKAAIRQVPLTQLQKMIGELAS